MDYSRVCLSWQQPEGVEASGKGAATPHGRRACAPSHTDHRDAGMSPGLPMLLVAKSPSWNFMKNTIYFKYEMLSSIVKEQVPRLSKTHP